MVGICDISLSGWSGLSRPLGIEGALHILMIPPTLSHVGMNKMVINHLEKLFVTSDASTIVTELEVNHPAAKLLVMAAQSQAQENGDGTNLVRLAPLWLRMTTFFSFFSCDLFAAQTQRSFHWVGSCWGMPRGCYEMACTRQRLQMGTREQPSR